MFLVGGGVLVLNLAIPTRLSAWAEALVGVLLAYIGARLLGSLLRSGGPAAKKCKAAAPT